jgi:hypothetical protein
VATLCPSPRQICALLPLQGRTSAVWRDVPSSCPRLLDHRSIRHVLRRRQRRSRFCRCWATSPRSAVHIHKGNSEAGRCTTGRIQLAVASNLFSHLKEKPLFLFADSAPIVQDFCGKPWRNPNRTLQYSCLYKLLDHQSADTVLFKGPAQLPDQRVTSTMTLIYCASFDATTPARPARKMLVAKVARRSSGFRTSALPNILDRRPVTCNILPIITYALPRFQSQEMP